MEDEEFLSFKKLILSHEWERDTDVIIEMSNILEEADTNDILFSFFKQHGIHLEENYRMSFDFDLAKSTISREKAIEEIYSALDQPCNYSSHKIPFYKHEREKAARDFFGFFQKPVFYEMPERAELWQNENTNEKFTYDHGPIIIGGNRIGIFYVKNIY